MCWHFKIIPLVIPDDISYGIKTMLGPKESIPNYLKLYKSHQHQKKARAARERHTEKTDNTKGSTVRCFQSLHAVNYFLRPVTNYN